VYVYGGIGFGFGAGVGSGALDCKSHKYLVRKEM
jgi:hypothetical protein